MLQVIWQKIQQWSWLVLALICWFFAMAFWASTTETEDVLVLTPAKPAETQQQLQPETIAASDDLGTLTEQVRPLNVGQRFLASGEHEVEFRGTKFIKDNQNSWTIELFRVTSEDVVKGFLKALSNRSHYYYFRLTRPQQADSYILIYGVFASEYEAENQLKQLQQKWPSQVKPKLQTFRGYIPEVNDLGAEELKAKSTLNAVRLTEVAIPVVNLFQPKLIPESSNLPEPSVVTKTTVVQRDAAGNVINVEQSKSRVVELNLKPENSPQLLKPESRSLQHDGVALPNANN